MKRNYLYYLLIVLLLAVSCEKDERAYTTTVETQEVSSIAATTAQCGGMISSDGNPTIKEVGVEWCTTSDFESNVSCSLADKAKLGKFACEITDLKDNTQYYVRAYARNSYGTIYGEVLSFKTLEIVLPAVLTDSVTNITISSATIGGEVTDESNGVVTERGVVYSTTPNPTIENSKVVSGSGKGSFSSNLTALQDGVTYYVRAYAVNEKGTAYGEEKSFQTIEIVVPTVITAAATDITISSATVGGEVTEDGNGVVTERGVVYSTTPNPTVENNKIVCGSGKGSFSSNLTALQDGVTYYVRAYAVNEKGTAYGEEKSFQTIEIVVPTVITAAATDITISSATVGGDVTEDGNGVVTERGVVYSTTPNPTVESNKVVSGSGKGLFSSSLTALQDGVTYYVRAYAVNEKGTAYGEEKSFKTIEIVVPTVTTSSVMNISYTSATVGGIVTDDGGATVTERGLVYSTTPNPTTSNTKVSSGSGKGAFSSSLTALQDGVTYYVRAYAVNEKGTAYGEETSFTTKAITVPIVTTSSATNISFTSVTVGGTVTDDSGATVTERGVVYSTTPNPTTSNSKISSGSGKGAFTCNLTDLQDGTTYYVRAYAVNQKGTAYGEEKSFTTKAIVVPTIITSSATNISYTSATVGGNVTDDGGASIIERGIVYATSQNPTIDDSKLSNGSGLGAFSGNISELNENTTYYARAYAVNKKGIAYGEEISFATKAIVKPSITTGSAKNISSTSATVDGNVTSDGGASVTERGVVYSTNQNPTIENSIVTSGGGLGAFTCQLTELQSGVTYYARAYATNKKGTTYGNSIQFTTFEIHEYIDLGLSVKWATCNIGANQPEDVGNYFAWGETEPKVNFNLENYKWYNKTSSTLTKYCTNSEYGIVDNKRKLDLNDDAAHVNWGGNWRMPTTSELNELINKCTWTGTDRGCIVTSKINGNSIYLPLAGERQYGSTWYSGSIGFYHSSELAYGYPYPYPAGLCFFLRYVEAEVQTINRAYGYPIRPVCP